ncbi:MAG: glycosyltransferase family 2 protein [Acidobacteria bacterium]|nr:MAG: glycosyltransferase family 2 protein [Acidobacteriota bacterium]
MPANPIVTVIIPTRNRAHLLRRAMESVLTQTFGDLELIIVDDASDDATESMVKGIHDPRVRYIRCESHRGAPAARNTGIRAARGQYLAFQDSDDEWLPLKLERQLEVMNRHSPHAGAATCGTVAIQHGVAGTSIARRERLSYAGLLSLSERPWGGQTILVKRTPATEDVLFDERLPSGQDWDYLVRLAQVTQVVSVREPLVRIGFTARERISAPRRKLEGTRLLREKYDEELRRHPQALVAHEVRLGRLSLACGDAASARRHFVKALMISPFQPRVLSLLGASFIRRPLVRRILRRSPLADVS